MLLTYRYVSQSINFLCRNKKSSDKNFSRKSPSFPSFAGHNAIKERGLRRQRSRQKGRADCLSGTSAGVLRHWERAKRLVEGVVGARAYFCSPAFALHLGLKCLFKDSQQGYSQRGALLAPCRL
jgi:hypothetical protein